MEIFSLLFMLYLGIKFLRAKTVEAPAHLGRTADKIEERLGEKFHPHSAFMVGFVRTMANPGVLLFWIILAANFISREWVRPDWPGKSACVGGVALGTGLWFFVLSFGSSRGHGRLGEKTLLRMEHFSGICLLVVAVVHGGQIGWQIARHKF
jgi:threonine/homoserine/homoserine lactone efflux protein